MYPFLRFVLIGFMTLAIENRLYSGDFETIEVNKRNQKERSNNYFDVGVSDGSYGRLNFTVQVKRNALDAKASVANSRIEIMEGGRPAGLIPIQRRARQDGGGHFVQFELAPELAEKCILVLVEMTGEADGNIYRVDLYSFTKEGADKARPILDEMVQIEFPKDGYSYTLADVAKGIKIEYKVVVKEDYEGVIAMPYGPSFAEPPGPSGLHPREQISGKGQGYCLFDSGLGQPPTEVVKPLKKGTYLHSFEWDGRNWSGPSDTGNPKGEPFPAGTYELKVTMHGLLATDKGKIPYQISGKTKLVLK